MLPSAAQLSPLYYCSVCSNANSLQNLPMTLDTAFTINGILQPQQSAWTESLNTFEDSFMAMQQVIAADQLALQEQMETFLELMEKQYQKNSTHSSPPPNQNSVIDAMYSRSAIYRYFFTAHCIPMQAGDCWNHHISRMKHRWTIFAYVSNMDLHHHYHHNLKTRLNEESSSVTTTTQQTLPMAYIQPTYGDYSSTAQRDYTAANSLPQPTITHCPPWPPPHRPRWYSINVQTIPPRSS